MDRLIDGYHMLYIRLARYARYARYARFRDARFGTSIYLCFHLLGLSQPICLSPGSNKL